jgi:hypothetical protein
VAGHHFLDHHVVRIAFPREHVDDDVAVGEQPDRAPATEGAGRIHHHEATHVALAHHPRRGRQLFMAPYSDYMFLTKIVSIHLTVSVTQMRKNSDLRNKTAPADQ